MDFLQFAVERYNYWIFIILMMMGLYTVIARGNLIKKIIGLNVFQTSVFIYYISIGKITGGTAPIYVGDDMAARAGHGSAHEGGETAALKGHDALGQGALHADPSVHAGANSGGAEFGAAGNSLDALAGHAAAAPDTVLQAGAVHAAPQAGADVNAMLSAPTLTVEGGHDAAGGMAGDVAVDAVGALAHSAGEVIYSNPLPHVLILTAIVVGVATTAVGLALAVRIREAYGTIEEDELEAADNIAEFGHAAPSMTAPSIPATSVNGAGA
ncbi:MAG: cation:proton antiporter subunit C [Parvularculaceae bacterium]|nr:cation:proton antiporter subunit C [Parvularculaceae bacterium]